MPRMLHLLLDVETGRDGISWRESLKKREASLDLTYKIFLQTQDFLYSAEAHRKFGRFHKVAIKSKIWIRY